MVIHRLPVRAETGVSFREFQAELTEVGRIRLGVFNPDKGKAGAPDKLDSFRFTSQQELLIHKVAERYGGEAREYQPQGSRNRTEWEVITQAKMVPVYIEPQRIEPWLEAWQPGRCIRRCDGITETKQDVPCPCAAGQLEERHMCKPVARVRLLLAEVPGIGTWRLESHGTKFVEEIAGLAPYVAALPYRVPGLLYLEARRAQPWVNGKQITAIVFVPHLSISVATPEQFAIGGDVLTRALEAGTSQALEAAERPALEATPAGATGFAAIVDWHGMIDEAADLDTLDRVKARLKSAGITDNDIRQHWRLRCDTLTKAAQINVLEVSGTPSAADIDPGLLAIAEAKGRSVAEMRATILRDIESRDTTGALDEVKAKMQGKGVRDKQIREAWRARYDAIVAAAEVGGSAPGATSVTAGNGEHQRALRDVQRQAAEVVDAVLVDEPPPLDFPPLDDQRPMTTAEQEAEYAVGDTVTVGGVEFTKVGDDPFGPGGSDIPPPAAFDLDTEINAVHVAAGALSWTTTQTNDAIKREAGIEKMSQLQPNHAGALHALAMRLRATAVNA